MKPLADMTVLIAEDERPVRMLLRVVLEAAGACVLEAEHGGVALRLLDLHPDVDVLCTDVNMPQVDGAQLVRAARRSRPGLPIVVCSAMDLERYSPAMSANVDAVVQKPFVPSDLVRAIASSVARRQLATATA